MRSVSLVGGVLAFMLLLGNCTFDVSFTQDRRLTILTPEDRTTVELPFDIRWEVTDFTIVGPGGESIGDDAGYFVLFFDHNPIPPGKDLRSVADNDPSCLQDPGCPDEFYLNQRNIYTTTATHFTVEFITDTRPRERPEATDWHEATIVLVTPAGKRIGESAFPVRFIVDRPVGPEF